MDVSPRALHAVTFREKLRGYHPEDVDAFLERVADGVAALQTKLDEAIARAEKAEVERAEASEGEEAVKRTLTLAQRTADLALKEAKEEAARLIAEAQHTADKIADDAQRQLRVDLEKLEAARKHLHDDVLAMQQYVEQERTRVREVLGDLVRKVDNAARRPAPPPAPTRLEVPPPVAVRPAPPPAEPASETAADVAAPEPAPPAPAEPAPADAPLADPDVEAERKPQPQPPPISTTFISRPAAVKPSGPPPGPRRHNQDAAGESPAVAEAAFADPSPAVDDGLDIRGLFTR